MVDEPLLVEETSILFALIPFPFPSVIVDLEIVIFPAASSYPSFQVTLLVIFLSPVSFEAIFVLIF